MIRLKYFVAAEFVRDGIDWLPDIAPQTLTSLDLVREFWGRPINISPHPHAIGRRLGGSKSRHNIDEYSQVFALDIMPDGIRTACDARQFGKFAEAAGFVGIGFYPHWIPKPGFHLDIRPNKARWGFLRSANAQCEVSYENAINQLPETIYDTPVTKL